MAKALIVNEYSPSLLVSQIVIIVRIIVTFENGSSTRAKRVITRDFSRRNNQVNKQSKSGVNTMCFVEFDRD